MFSAVCRSRPAIFRRSSSGARSRRPMKCTWTPCAHEVGELALDRLPEDLHQRVDLVARPRPVLGREGVDGERLDAEVDRRLDGPPERLRAGAVAGGDRQAAPARPAAVAVHDDRDRSRAIGKLGSSGGGLSVQSERMRVISRPRRRSDLHDLGFFVLQQLVDRVDVLVGELLHLFLGAVLLVGPDLARVDELLQVVHDVAAHVADGDPALLGDVPDDLDELLAPLLGELRDRQADRPCRRSTASGRGRTP